MTAKVAMPIQTCHFNYWLWLQWPSPAAAEAKGVDPWCHEEGTHCAPCGDSGFVCFHTEHLVCEQHYWFLEGLVHTTFYFAPTNEDPPTHQLATTINPWLREED